MRIKHFIRFTTHYATKLIPPMLRRLFLVFLPSLTASVSYANQASWNCEQNKDSKEWVCVGEKKQPTKTATTINSEPVKTIQPALTQPVEKTPPIKTQPVHVTEPIETKTTEQEQPVRAAQPTLPAAIESTQPVSPKPAPAISAVPTKAAENKQAIKPASVQTDKPLIAESSQSTQPAPRQSALDSSKSPAEIGKRPGWSCDSSNKEDWNCQLLGADSKGKPEAVANDEPTMRLLSPAFDHQQEQTFSTLASQLNYDPWENCSVEAGPKRSFVTGADKRDVTPLDVKSNYAEVFDNEIGSYSGNVKMARADQQASSNAANYDTVSETLDLHGNVYYSEDELALYSDSATLKLASDEARLRNVQFIAPTTPLRGRANAVYRDSKVLSRYNDVAYTSCRPGNQDWIAHASELKLNKTTGRGSAKNTWIEFKGTPVFYSPYLSFPIDDRRTSGFLAPVFGSTKNSGFNLSIPYYWNIAPNYDATLAPRYLTKRGPLLTGKFRYLTEQSIGNIGMELMPHDSLLKKSRYLGSIKNASQFTPAISSHLDLNYVSDKTYFSELGNALSFSNFNYLRSAADVNYVTQGIYFSSRAENYQSINTTTTAALPYRKLPQINLNLDHAFQFMPLYTAMENEYIYFQHSNLVDGQRINIKPSVSVPLQTASAFFTPKISLQHTQYLLNSKQADNPDTSISRTLPIFSADSGLFLERGFNIANTPFLHTLEPRLFYLYVPYTNQNDIPIFDTAQYDFQFNSMFRENSFSGTDRIQNANQITAAITSRLIDDKSGLERLKLSVGEIFYFQDRNVTLQSGSTPVPGSVVQTDNYSNLVTELSSELTDHVSVTSGLQWNPHLNDIERGKAALHFRNQANEIFNIGYLYRKNPLIPDRTNDIIQSDMSFRWPIYDNWYAMGRWQYSLLYNRTQDGFLGLEKENCCWRFRVAVRRYINNIANDNTIGTTTNTAISGTAQTGIFFQIELKGLTGIGENLDNFLEQTIYGYRKSQ